MYGWWEGVKVVHCFIDISPRSGLWNDKYRNHIVGQSTKRSVTINWNMNFPNRINCNLINYGIPICPILSILCMAFFLKKNVATPQRYLFTSPCSLLGIGSQIKSYCLTRNRQTQEWENGIITFSKMRFTLLHIKVFLGHSFSSR